MPAIVLGHEPCAPALKTTLSPPLDPAICDVYSHFQKDIYGGSWLQYLNGQYSEHLVALDGLRDNWDGAGAKAPNHTAKRLANYLTNAMAERNLPEPAAIVASVEAGIGIAFKKNRRRALIEVSNDGALVAALYEDRGEPEVWIVEHQPDVITNSLERIRAYLSA